MAVQVGFVKTCGLYLIFLLYVFPGISTEGHCLQKNSCRCEFENGTGVDLSSTVQSSFYQADFVKPRGNNTFEILTYYFHPCSDAKFKSNATAITPNHCEAEPLSICRKVLNVTIVNGTYGKITDNRYEKISFAKDATFSDDGSTIIYAITPSETTVVLACTKNINNQLVVQPVSAIQPDDVVLTFYTSAACLQTFTEEAHHPSLGSVLVIILFVMILTYLLLGMGTLYYSGARGIEIIPNLSFWTSLPALVREGFSFLRNGCKLPPSVPDHYDSI